MWRNVNLLSQSLDGCNVTNLAVHFFTVFAFNFCGEGKNIFSEETEPIYHVLFSTAGK